MNAEMKVEKGDTVRLKSGGPTMTIQKIDKFSSEGMDLGAVCVWFNKEKEPRERIFDVDVLTKYAV